MTSYFVKKIEIMGSHSRSPDNTWSFMVYPSSIVLWKLSVEVATGEKSKMFLVFCGKEHEFDRITLDQKASRSILVTEEEYERIHGILQSDKTKASAQRTSK